VFEQGQPGGCSVRPKVAQEHRGGGELRVERERRVPDQALKRRHGLALVAIIQPVVTPPLKQPIV
jgi:hypothetical protein